LLELKEGKGVLVLVPVHSAQLREGRIILMVISVGATLSCGKAGWSVICALDSKTHQSTAESSDMEDDEVLASG
jgi:hypothetical protein